MDLYNIGDRTADSGPLITDSPSLPAPPPTDTMTGVGEAILSGVASLDEWRQFILIHEDSSCLYRYDLRAKALPHLPQMCGLVFEWVWMWARRLDLSAKALLQIEHLKGFSPETITIIMNEIVCNWNCQWLIWPIITCVSPDVSLQKPRTAETFAAIVALAALIVGPHVHRIGGHADVQLVAVWTASGLFVCRTSVRLTVAGQVAGRAVTFAALAALVVAAAALRWWNGSRNVAGGTVWDGNCVTVDLGQRWLGYFFSLSTKWKINLLSLSYTGASTILIIVLKVGNHSQRIFKTVLLFYSNNIYVNLGYLLRKNSGHVF